MDDQFPVKKKKGEPLNNVNALGEVTEGVKTFFSPIKHTGTIEQDPRLGVLRGGRIGMQR